MRSAGRPSGWWRRRSRRSRRSRRQWPFRCGCQAPAASSPAGSPASAPGCATASGPTYGRSAASTGRRSGSSIRRLSRRTPGSRSRYRRVSSPIPFRAPPIRARFSMSATRTGPDAARWRPWCRWQARTGSRSGLICRCGGISPTRFPMSKTTPRSACRKWRGKIGRVLYILEPDGSVREHAIVAEDVAMADPTLFRYAGRYWIAYNDASLGLHENLCLRFADRLEGPWTAHPLNPVKIDVRCSRPGGTPFRVRRNVVPARAGLLQKLRMCADHQPRRRLRPRPV